MINADQARRRILDELRKVNETIEALMRDPRPEELEASGDNTPLTEEVDATIVVEENELKSDRLQRLHERVLALEEALRRVDEGTYGICIDCGKEIPPNRLEAVPEALRCVEDQERWDQKSPREKEQRGLEWKLAEEEDRDRRRAEDGV